MAKCVNHPYSNASYMHEGFTYCRICKEYFRAQEQVEFSFMWGKPFGDEDTTEFEDKISKLIKIRNDAMDKILRN